MNNKKYRIVGLLFMVLALVVAISIYFIDPYISNTNNYIHNSLQFIVFPIAVVFSSFFFNKNK